MSDWNNNDILRETEKTVEFVKANWTDALGNEYVVWLERILGEIKLMEMQREINRKKKEKIMILCSVIESDDDDPKILR